MFYRGFKETSDEKIELIDIEKEGFELVLDYIYRKGIKLNEKNIYQVFKAADYFQMKSLVDS